MATFPNFPAREKRGALAIFCRAPRLGTVKTRLAASHGDQFALELYRAMLADSFALGNALAPAVKTYAFFTPDDALADGSLSSLWDGAGLAQCQGDLGRKMLDCFAKLRSQGHEKIVVIGSDSPDVPLHHLSAAFDWLETSSLVVGPSNDGGFYLLGASVPVPPSSFEGITWSSAQVYQRLVENVAKTSLSLSHLPLWHDVDEEADLLDLSHRLFDLDTYAPQTRGFLVQQRNAL